MRKVEQKKLRASERTGGRRGIVRFLEMNKKGQLSGQQVLQWSLSRYDSLNKEPEHGKHG